jgi:hypothetical protein
VAPPELDDDHVAAICRTLAEHAVAFVVIGGVAARLHETGYATVDIDVCPSRAKGTSRDSRMRCERSVRGCESRVIPRAWCSTRMQTSSRT